MPVSQYYRLSPQLSVTEVDDEVVLLKLDTGSYFGLNPIGAKFVSGIQQEMSLHEICASISEQYQTPYIRVNDDLKDLVDQLVDQQLIEAYEPG